MELNMFSKMEIYFYIQCKLITYVKALASVTADLRLQSFYTCLVDFSAKLCLGKVCKL